MLTFPIFSKVLKDDDWKTIREAQLVFDKMTGIDYTTAIGHQQSLQGRYKQNLMSNRYVYGEIKLESFVAAMKSVQKTHSLFSEPGGTFVDLGSGQGKVVLMAALTLKIDRVVGIE
jgi:hypothetical protein